jgi:UDP-glucose 4-epimerase
MIRLLELAEKNIPLPFGHTKNARSMVYLDNLIAMINHIIEKKPAGIFIGGDALPLSTDQLISLIRKSLGKNPGLISLPDFMRNILKQLKPALYSRLFGSFEVDNSSTNKKLNFIPPYSSEEGITEMVKWYLKH